MVIDAAPLQKLSTLPQVVETKITLDGRRKQFHCRVVDRTTDAVVLLFISDQEYLVADLALPAGTVTLGYFWSTRPYNVYHWMTPEGRTLAHYFNVAGETKVMADALEWHDLTLDVLVRPGAAPLLLDEHELPAALDPGKAAMIARARDVTLADAPGVAVALEAESTRLWPRLFGTARP